MRQEGIGDIVGGGCESRDVWDDVTKNKSDKYNGIMI